MFSRVIQLNLITQKENIVALWYTRFRKVIHPACILFEMKEMAVSLWIGCFKYCRIIWKHKTYGSVLIQTNVTCPKKYEKPYLLLSVLLNCRLVAYPFYTTGVKMWNSKYSYHLYIVMNYIGRNTQDTVVPSSWCQRLKFHATRPCYADLSQINCWGASQ